MTGGDGRPQSPRSQEADDSQKVDDSQEADEENLLTRFRTAESGPLMFIREVLTSVAAVALVALLLFAISGVWPPMVAVESPSMDPHMQKGDLIFVTEPGRFTPSYAHDETGVVTYETGRANDYKTFDEYGSVVIYAAPERNGPPIIHRAMFWVEDGENWYDRANPAYVQGDSCAEVANCPAPHAGFITKGDNNPYYDQASRISTVVKPDWVIGVARIRIPYLGWIRLGLSGAFLPDPGAGMASALEPTAPANEHGPVRSDANQDITGPTATTAPSLSNESTLSTPASGPSMEPTEIGGLVAA